MHPLPARGCFCRGEPHLYACAAEGRLGKRMRNACGVFCADVPLHMKRSRKGSVPHVQDEPAGTKLRYFVLALRSDTKVQDRWIPQTTCVHRERLGGRAVSGLRLHGNGQRRPYNAHSRSQCGRNLRTVSHPPQCWTIASRAQLAWIRNIVVER